MQNKMLQYSEKIKVKEAIIQRLVVELLFLVVVMTPKRCVQGKATVNCKYNEFITEDILGHQSCVACPNCTVGYGLTPECGSFIKYGNKFGCKRCVNGISYSTSNSIGSCQPCGICTDHQTIISNCNRTHNSKCGKSCEKGFYYSDVTFDCQECSWCCEGSGGNRVKKCEVSGVPFYKQCSVDDSLGCQPRCSEKQFVFVDKTLKKTCIDCPTCGIGKGVYPECSSVITSKTEPKCTTCDPGNTFSDVNDDSSCKLCTKCAIGKEIERRCNATHDTLCGNCMHGFYTDESNNKQTCKACSFCCGDKLDVRVPECVAQGMPAVKRCAYTERAVMKCNKPKTSEQLLAISLGSGIVAFLIIICLIFAGLFYTKKFRYKYGQLVEASSDTLVERSSDNRLVQEPPSRGSTPSIVIFRQSGVKVKCQVPDVGQELLEKISAEVCWDNYHYPKLKEREVFLSPVIKLHPQGFQVPQQAWKVNLLHSAHYDNDNQYWSIAVHKSCNPYDDSSPSEWTDLSQLQNVLVEQGGIEFSEDALGTYVVVGTPGEDQTLSKKRMCCAVFGTKEPRVGKPYFINMYLFDDCEPSFMEIRDEEEHQGHYLLTSLRLFHPDVHPNSVINVNIEHVSDGWVVDYMPKKFKCEQWIDSYRRHLKVEAKFDHQDTDKQDFRCLFKVKVNDTTPVEVPVMQYFEDYMSERLLSRIQVSDRTSYHDVTQLLESPVVSLSLASAVPLLNFTNDRITELSKSVDPASVESFARKIIPDISECEVALICSSAEPVVAMIDMAKRRNPFVTPEELDAALKQSIGISQEAQEKPPSHQNGSLLI